MSDQIYRCSDGHLFTATWPKLVFMSVHFGASKLTRCPVDSRWRMITWVAANHLSAADLADAQRHRF